MALATSIPAAAFTGGLHRRTVRSDVNPFDKATIFSVYPRTVKAEHVTTQPSTYEVPPGDEKNPGRLVVGPSSWWRDIDPEQPLLEIRCSAIQVADSIVNDHNKARFGATPHIGPGLFYLPGEVPMEELFTKHSAQLLRTVQKQREWYKILVEETDTMWAQSNGSPRVVDDFARIAAHELGLQRDWLTNFQATEMVKCIACGQLRNPEFPVCNSCHAVIDKAKADKLGLTFAK